LQAQADSSQNEIKSYLQNPSFAKKISKLRNYWIINGLSLQATGDVIFALASRPDVSQIIYDAPIPAPVSTQAAGAAWDNLGKIGAPELWSLGFRGQGIVVANLDTGVDYTHPEFASRWRGGTNSWYDPADPAGSHPLPTDLPAGCGAISGHGTGTMGVIVGSSVGVAPDAKWIAVKIFSDDYTTDPTNPCPAATSSILSGFQWVLDPDGNPATPDAPQVVNNSWGGPGCDAKMVFEPALKTLRAAGVIPVFAAGNNGPILGSSTYPGNYPEAFPVGATDSQDVITSYSSRGPNSCVSPAVTYPQLVAPGDYIRTTGPGGTYVLERGTSFSAPHVAGAIALLLSAFPQNLTIQQQETALVSSAVDLGTIGPDNNYGYGRLDAFRAYQWFLTDAQIGFSAATQSVNETAGIASIVVTRSGGISFPVSVDFSVSGGTAVAGLNYLPPTTNQLNFAASETQKTILIDILHDSQPGPSKTIFLSLSNARVAGSGSVQTATINPPLSQSVLTILNSDPWLSMLPIISR
jgi:subtilisin family serine protease